MIKYKIEFSDIRNELWRVEIDSPSYSGEVIDLIPADKPLIKEYNGNQDDDIFRQHFIPSSITLSVVNTRVDIDELMYINDASFKCRVYRSNVLDWQGYVISDGIQEVDSGIPYDMTIRAIDGIEVLDNIPLVWNNYGRVSVNGQLSEYRAPINAYRVSLYSGSNLDNILPIKWNTPLKNNQYPTRDMLAGATQIAPSGELLDKGNTCLWWLDNLSKSAQSWIYQKSGYWYINNYFRSLSGVFGGYEIGANTGQDITAVTNNEPTVTALTAQDTVNENWFWFGKKPYGSVSVLYNDTKFVNNNVIPNGDFSKVSTGIIMYWQPTVSGIITSQAVGLDDTSDYAMNIDSAFATSDGYINTGSIPIDTELLYRECVLGFQWLPISGFPTTGEGFIDFTKFPMHISVKLEIGGVERYLNEFGYWSDKNASANQEIVSAQIIKEGTPYVLRIQFNTSKSFFPGDRFHVTFLRGGNREFYTHVFTETIDVEGGLNILESIIPNSVNPVSPPGQLGILNVDNNPNFSVIMDKVDNYYKKVEIDGGKNMKHNDILAVAFQSKGGSTNIKIPRGLGKLTYSIFVPRAVNMTIGNVYFNVNDSHDIYTVSSVGSKNSKANYNIDISSSYNGNMESSYGNSPNTRNESMNFDGMTLTESYARRIMEVRNRPMRVFSGSIDRIVEWGLFSLMGKVYTPLSMRVDVRDRITDVVGAEFTPSQLSWEVKHTSSGG